MKDKIRTRLYAANAGAPGLRLDDPDTINVSRVLRLRRGERVDCFNGDGNSYIYEVLDAQRGAFELQFQRKHPNPNDSIPETTVFCASVKGKNNDRIVRDITPLGATRIVFYYAKRSVSRPETNQQQRLQKIAIEACRQCGRSTLPKVEIQDQPISEAVDHHKSAILFWESESKEGLKIKSPQKPIQLIFGPEGGFVDDEIEWAKQSNIQFSSLGPRILRSELAITVGMTLIQNLRGIFDPHSPHHNE